MSEALQSALGIGTRTPEEPDSPSIVYIPHLEEAVDTIEACWVERTYRSGMEIIERNWEIGREIVQLDDTGAVSIVYDRLKDRKRTLSKSVLSDCARLFNLGKEAGFEDVEDLLNSWGIDKRVSWRTIRDKYLYDKREVTPKPKRGKRVALAFSEAAIGYQWTQQMHDQLKDMLT